MRLFSMITCFILLCLASCWKERALPEIRFSPNQRVFSVNDEPFSLSCNLKSAKGLMELSVFYISPLNGEVLDTSYALSGQTATKQYLFNRSSEHSSDETIYVRFILTSNDGSYTEEVLRFDVSIDNTFQYFPNQSFYSASAPLFNAYSIEDALSVTFEEQESVAPDIRELVIDTSVGPGHVSYRWFSPSGCRFVKLNNIDFDQVSLTSLSDIYNNSISSSFTDSVVNGDIYAVRTPNDRVALIRLNGVSVSEGIGRYSFDMKR